MQVLLAGDSTVASCPAAETPMSGWGAHLGAPLNAGLASRAARSGRTAPVVGVVNVAKGGANTSSFRGEGLWDALLLAASSGDVVVMQFGHNDQKIPTLAPWDGYARNLERFVEECGDRGLRPVLCTSVARRRFVDGRLVPTLGEYPDAVTQLGSRLGVPVVDLHTATSALYEAWGEEGSRALFTQFAPDTHPLYRGGVADDTHFSITGAQAVAQEVATALVPIIEEEWA
ncbi:MAG TPA: rhamnogalacturonan acetylesterase [Propionibacteriaceae bacterium]|nr:rhamnogalacturonan acetylesterase [Propionibacteriaceae bacterium]